MAQPTPYDRQFNFQNQQALTPTAPLPGDEVDNELNAVKVTIDQTLVNLALIQRDDGALKNGVVTQDSLADSLSIGFTLRGPWALTVNYVAGDGVTFGDSFYRCLVANLSTNLNRPDVDAVTWQEVADFAGISGDAADSAAAALASENAAAASATASSGFADASAASATASSGFADASAASATASSGFADASAASALEAATLIGGTVTEAVRHDVAQGLSAGQQLQARENVGMTAAGSTIATAVSALAQRAALLTGVLQVATSAYTTYGNTGAAVIFDDTIPQRTEMTDIVSIAFTPRSASSTLVLIGLVQGYLQTTASTAVAIFENGNANALRAQAQTTQGGYFLPLPILHVVASGSTSARTYVMSAGGAQTVYINGINTGRNFGGAMGCHLVIIEIGA